MEKKILHRTKTEDIIETLKEFCELNEYELSDIDFNLISEEITGDIKSSIKKLYEIEILNKDDIINPLRNCAKILFSNPINPMIAYLYVFHKKFEYPISFSLQDIAKSVKKLIAINKINFGIAPKKLDMISADLFTRISKPNYKPFKITLATGRLPEDGKDSRINFYFDQYTKSGKIDDKGKVDYHKKGFASVVSKDSLLVEYIAPTKGKAGMDVHGTLIPQKEGKDTHPFNIIAGKGTRLEKDERTKRIYSTKLGYASIRGRTVEVKEDITVDQINVVKTGDINLSKTIPGTITIKKADVMKDAVSSGMNVEGHIIHIKGNVGKNARITGDNVVIEGLLHKDATVNAKTVTINICRGTVFAEKATVNSAEYANILCNDSVEASTVVSSRLIADSIKINGKVMNSNLVNGGGIVSIKEIIGNDNKIAIDPLAIPKNKKEYEELISSKNEILKLISKNKISLVKITKEKNLKTKDALKIAERISQIEKRGDRVPTTLILSLKRYRELLKELEKESWKIHEISKRYALIINKIKKMRELYLDGKIIVSGNLPKGTVLKFDDTLEKRVISNVSGVKIAVKSEHDFKKITLTKLE